MLVDSTFNRALPNDLFAVLDPARDPILFDTMTVLAPDAQCLFGGELADAVRRASPHVMAMPQPGLLLDWWRQNGRGKSYGIACRGDVGMQALRLHLKTLLRVRLPDGRLVLFRFWDPRVLEIFIKNSTPLEQARLFGPIRTFYGESPEGRSIAWDRPEGIEVPARSEMQISPSLWAAFSAVDKVDFRKRLAAMVLNEYQRFEIVRPETVQERIEPMIVRAEEFGFTTEMEIAAFVIATVPVGEERLIRTVGFCSAAFTPDATPSQRATWLDQAGHEAMAAR
jgi:hypothetical protein